MGAEQKSTDPRHSARELTPGLLEGPAILSGRTERMDNGAHRAGAEGLLSDSSSRRKPGSKLAPPSPGTNNSPGANYMSISAMPPMPPGRPAGAFSPFGSSETIASVVKISAELLTDGQS